MSDEKKMNVYEIEDGATHHIAAPDLWSAIEAHKKYCGCDMTEPDFQPEEFSVRKLSAEDAEKCMIYDDDMGEKRSAAYFASQCTEPCEIGCSEY